MKKFLNSRYIFFFALFLLLAHGSGRLYYRLTDGFRMNTLKRESFHEMEWDFAYKPEEIQKIKSILSQKFTYYSKGRHAYVFVSEDHKWVIKFPKFQRYKINPLLALLPLPEGLNEMRARKADEKKENLGWLFDSWKIAFLDIPEQTGVVFAHINNTSYGFKTTLVNKLGWDSEVDLGGTSFIIQKKTQPFKERLEELYAKKQIDEAKLLLKRLVSMWTQEYAQGIIERDQHILHNTGHNDGRPFHINSTRFEKDEEVIDKSYWTEILYDKTVKLRHYLKVKMPELVESFEKDLKEAGE